MADSGTKRGWGRVLPYAFGGFLCLLTAVATTQGTPWYLAVGVLCAALTIMLGTRRIFRPSIIRTANEIVCRYIPWYEGNAYILWLALPSIAIAMIIGGRDPDNPAWFKFFGIILATLTPLFVHSIIRIWRRSLLRISPSALTIRLPTPGFELTEIRREQIESITAMVAPSGLSRSLQVEVAYHAPDTGSDEIKTVMLGLHLTVKPINLANALIAWDDAAIDDPDELLDLIERVLRSKSVSDVAPPPSRSALEAQRDTPEDDSDHV